MGRLGKWLLMAGGLAGLAGGVALTWYHLPIQQRYYTDADTIRTPTSEVTPRDVLWQPPRALGEVLNTEREDYEPRLSWDGLTLYFVRGKAGENADIYQATRTPTGWTAAEPVVAVNSGYDELGPEPAPDGQALYFYSDRPGGAGGYDLWVVRRGTDGWLPATNLGPMVNSPFNDYGPAVTPDGGDLYFASNRPREGDAVKPAPAAWPATVREEVRYRTYDLYRAALTDAGAQPAIAVDELNTSANEGSPCVSPAGDFLYFASDRSGGAGGFDLYRARRLGTEHAAAVNLGTPVNTAANELDPGLTHLGYALYFSRDSRPATGPDVERSDYDLYLTTAREVFAETESHRRPPLAWAQLWAAVWPGVLWLLLALASLLALRLLAGGVRDGKLGLLARCLIASLTAHALLMLALSFWQVGSALADGLRRGRIQVVLAATDHGDALAAQICAGLTQLEMPAVPAVEPQRSEPVVAAAVPVTLVALPPAESEQWISEDVAVPFKTRDAEVPQSEAITQDVPPNAAAALTELAVPAAARPVASAEAERPPEPESRSDVRVPRCTVAVPTSQPVRDTTVWDVSEGHDAVAVTDARSLVDEVKPRDVTDSQVPHAHVTVPANSKPPVIDVAVPDETRAAAAREADAVQPYAVGAAATETHLAVPLPQADAPYKPIELALPPACDIASQIALDLADDPLVRDAPPPGRGAGMDSIVERQATALPLALGLPSETETRAGVEAIGTIHGRVHDAQTRTPLWGATVRLDVPDGRPLVAQTDAGGRYTLAVPDLPEHVALSASLDGYIPATANVPAWRLRRTTLEQDFALEPESDEIVVFEPEPEVHHLGNDRWDGRINSQFQKRAEGRILRAYIELNVGQLPPLVRTAEVLLLVKGVQCPHRISLNGHHLDRRLDHAPADGSFGEFAAPFDPAWLTGGVNVLEIRAASCHGDVDDFELVNLQVRLAR